MSPSLAHLPVRQVPPAIYASDGSPCGVSRAMAEQARYLRGGRGPVPIVMIPGGGVLSAPPRPPAAIRAQRQSARVLTGLAKPFGETVRASDGYWTRFEPGAFAHSLSDVYALIDHDWNRRAVARTSEGTLRLWEEPSGLYFELDADSERAESANLRRLGLCDAFHGVSIEYSRETFHLDDLGCRIVTKADVTEISLLVKEWPRNRQTYVAYTTPKNHHGFMACPSCSSQRKAGLVALEATRVRGTCQACARAFLVKPAAVERI